MRTLVLLCSLGVSLCAPLATARISAVSLQEIIASSDEIVIAKVTEVPSARAGLGKLAYADAVVRRSLKGSFGSTFTFGRSPAHLCNPSCAAKGETALFFLGRNSDGPYVVALAGYGRMPLRVVNGKTYVTFWSAMIVLPEDAPTIAGPYPEFDFIKSVELAYIESLIKKHG